MHNLKFAWSMFLFFTYVIVNATHKKLQCFCVGEKLSCIVTTLSCVHKFREPVSLFSENWQTTSGLFSSRIGQRKQHYKHNETDKNIDKLFFRSSDKHIGDNEKSQHG